MPCLVGKLLVGNKMQINGNVVVVGIKSKCVGDSKQALFSEITEDEI